MASALQRRGALAALWLALVAAAPAAAQQDAWDGVERVVAVGDVHGDFAQLARVLRAAEVVDEGLDWAGGKAHLVQLGDVFGRGREARKALDLLMKLEAQAAKAGGAVHPLIGNHEAMMLLGDWRYAHPAELEAFGGAEAYRKALSPQGRYGKWLRSHNTVIRINGTLFVHGGLTAAYARMSLREINDAVRAQLARSDEDGPAMRPDGPLWDRSLALGDDADVQEMLEPLLRKHEAARIVIAHTVTSDGLAVQAGGRVIRIDVGMCEHYGGPAACLAIEKGAFYEVRHPKARRRLDVSPPARQLLPRPAP